MFFLTSPIFLFICISDFNNKTLNCSQCLFDSVAHNFVCDVLLHPFGCVKSEVFNFFCVTITLQIVFFLAETEMVFIVPLFNLN